MSLQVVLSASVGRGFQGDIAVDDVTFTDGLCESGSASRGGIGTYITNSGRDKYFTLLFNLSSQEFKWRISKN